MDMTKWLNNNNIYVYVYMHACMLTHIWLFETHELQLVRLLCPWDSPSKNVGVGCQVLLQTIYLIQRLNPCFLHSCIGRRIFTTITTWEAHICVYIYVCVCVCVCVCVYGVNGCYMLLDSNNWNTLVQKNFLNVEFCMAPLTINTSDLFWNLHWKNISWIKASSLWVIGAATRQ